MISDGVRGGFVLDAETCHARHPSGMAFRQSGDSLSFGVETENPEPLSLYVSDRIIFTQPLAPLHGVASTGFTDSRAFWSAFGQADRMSAGGISIPVADQAGLRDALAACATGQGAS